MNKIEQGIHAGVSMDAYIRDPAPAPSLNTGAAKAILDECPARAWFDHPRLNPQWQPGDDNAATDIGRIAHAVLLEGDASKLVIVDAEDWRTKAAREARELARAQGKIPLLADKWPEIEAMVKVAQPVLAEIVHELTKGQIVKMIEHTIVWKHGDVWCRSRPDILLDSEAGPIFIDYKTTAMSAEPNSVAKLIINNGYDLQAGLIRDGVYTIKGHTPDGVFLVQETTPPYLCSRVGLSPTFGALVDKRAEIAIMRWAECLKNNSWPAYPKQICWVEPPAWALARAEELDT